MRPLTLILPVLCAASVLFPRPAFGQVNFSSSNLPIISINTHGYSIPDEPKIAATMGIIDNGPWTRNAVTDPFNDFYGEIGIEVRGSSSQQFPKKQYALETRDSAGNGVDKSLLKLPAESDWVLIAAYNDKTLLRDALMYALVARTGRYVSRTRYCELVLNGNYMGVYILAEKPKRNKNRVNISKLSPADTAGDALTGGYIIKEDKIEGADTQGWNSPYPPFSGCRFNVYYQYHYPSPGNIVPVQAAYIRQYMTNLEATFSGSDFSDSTKGYPALLDVDSFVDYSLFSEFGKNVDSYRLSAFMHKDRDSKGGRLVMGPMWDYTIAFGNCDFYDASIVTGLQLTYLVTSPSFVYADSFQVPFWWRLLSKDKSFHAAQCERWNELRKDLLSVDGINSWIDSVAAVIKEARERNFKRWPILGVHVWGNSFVGKTYEDEIAYLKEWIGQRISWMDSFFRLLVSLPPSASPGVAAEFDLSQNFPNPFNATTTIKYTVSGARGQGIGASEVRIVIYDLLGRDVATLVNTRQAPGTYEVKFDGSQLASGVYFCHMTAGSFTQVRRMILAK